MNHQAQKAALVAALAKLEAAKRSNHTAQDDLAGRAGEQLDTMPEALGTVREHLTADIGGGIMGHRRHATMLTERARLEQMNDDHRRRRDARGD